MAGRTAPRPHGCGIGCGIGIGICIGICIGWGTLIVSLINVTAPLRASARPLSVTPSFIEIDDSAMIVPAKSVDVSSVAELPICQKTLLACAALMRFTRLPTAVVSADPTWKTKTALGSPWPSSVTVPVSLSAAPPL